MTTDSSNHDESKSSVQASRRDVLGVGAASFALPLLAFFGLEISARTEVSVGDFDTSGQSAHGQDQLDVPAEPSMKVRYLEVVTSDVEAVCNQLSVASGVTFGDADPSLGGARTAKLNGGGLIGIRGPLRKTEKPVVRPYMLVEDIQKAVAAAAKAGAEVAIESMPIPGHGTIAIVIQGGIECGFWQNESE